MSKFNKIPDIARELYERSDATTNYEGALAFKLDPLTELYLRAASTLVGEPKFYTDAGTSDNELLKSIHKVAEIDPEFILQLAIYCREKLYLRSVPLVLIAEFANDTNCVGKVPGARKYVERVVQRADELTELMSYQLARNKSVPRPSKSPVNKRQDKQTALPQMLKFGLAKAFLKFDGYQLGKYNRDNVVKLRDVMFMTHPKPRVNDIEQASIFDKLANQTLESPETWEVMRSTGKMTWHDVINKVFYKNSRVNNYMAQLKNLRNCLQDDSVTVDDIALLCKMISDKNAVLYSRQLPFRFFAAYKELYSANYEDFTPVGTLYLANVMDVLETAVLYSVENFPKLSGTSTLIACDFSQSMTDKISERSVIERFDIGVILGTIANRFCGHTITGIFGDDWKVVPMTKTSGILKNAIDMHKRIGEVGYSTNGYKAIKYLLDNGIKVDRIMIFTDSQMWDSERRRYWGDRDQVSFAERFIRYQRLYPEVKLYTFDLSGYGNVAIPQDTRNACFIGGWSDRVFEFIDNFESLGDGKILINKIKEIKST